MKVLRVFANDEGKWGNPVGIVVDEEKKLNTGARQQIAKKSGFSEVVFVNDLRKNSISIYTPQREIAFAGHAAVGVAHFLKMEKGTLITKLVGIGGEIETWQEGKLTWVRCDLAITPPWNYEQLQSEQEVVGLNVDEMKNKEHVVMWAWKDETSGLIRARTFALDWGIPEDEANGSGCLKLAVELKREVSVSHGNGSVVYARPAKQTGYGEVGGWVVGD